MYCIVLFVILNLCMYMIPFIYSTCMYLCMSEFESYIAFWFFMLDITSVDIDTNGTGLFRIVYNASTSSRVSKDGCSPESNDDSYSRLSNNGNYRRKRKVKGTPTVQRSSNNISNISSNVNQDEVDVEQRQLVLTSAIPSQLSQWLEKLRQYRHLDAIS